MLWPGTLIGAGAGFAIASSPGAMLGALLGQALDRRLCETPNWLLFEIGQRLGLRLPDRGGDKPLLIGCAIRQMAA